MAVLLAGCAAPVPPPPNGSLIPAVERVVLDEVTGESLLDPTATLSSRTPASPVVVVNIWGAWCGPCRGEAPELERAYAATRGDGLRFLGINVRDHVRQ